MKLVSTAIIMLAISSPVYAQTEVYIHTSPPFPLFRCDGQRPPMIGSGHCPNWTLYNRQMRVLELQERELRARLRQHNTEFPEGPGRLGPNGRHPRTQR